MKVNHAEPLEPDAPSAPSPPSAPSAPPPPPDSVYHILWAGRFHGLQIVADGKGVHESLSDPVSRVYAMPAHLWQAELDFEEEEP